MKLVWKCDYCSSTDVDKGKIEEHERDCVFNPMNRHCYSCDGLEQDYELQVCALKCKDFYDVFDKDKKCDLWYNSELRKKKLKILRNKINENS